MPDNLLNCIDCPYYKSCQFQSQERDRIALENSDKYTHYLPVEKTKQDIVL